MVQGLGWVRLLLNKQWWWFVCLFVCLYILTHSGYTRFINTLVISIGALRTGLEQFESARDLKTGGIQPLTLHPGRRG